MDDTDTEQIELQTLKKRKEAVEVNPLHQEKLLTSLKDENLEEFRQLLHHTDVNHFYPLPEAGTCLYIAASKGLLEFVKLLIKKGADVNGYNNIRKHTPLHAACKEARPEIVQLLLKHGAKTSEKDGFGRQPLHVSAFIGKGKYKDEHLQCLKALLDSGACKDTQDRSGSTALHLALIKNNIQAAETLIHYGVNLDINPASGETVRELIRKLMPSSNAISPFPIQMPCANPTTEENIERQLFRCMDNKDLIEFKRLLREAENKGVKIGEISDGRNNLLQNACVHEELEGFITVLLENPTVDPNGTCNCEKWTPLLLAAMKGNYRAIEILIHHEKTDVTVVDKLTKETALHIAVRMERGSTEEMNYLKSINILVGETKGGGSDRDPLLQKRLNTNAVDSYGNTALHYSGFNLEKQGREAEEIVLALLRAGAYAGIRNNIGELAISRVTPSLLEDCLDQYLSANGKSAWAEDYEMTFDFSMLIPPSSDSTDTKKEDLPTFKETEILSYFCNNKEYENILKHPIITSFLNLKWHRVKGIFYINLFFYMLFVASITAYILGVYGSEAPDDTEEHTTSMQWTDACSVVSVICLAGLALRELFQLAMSPLLYIKSLENLLEVAVIVLSVTMLLSSLDHDIKQQMAAVIILFVWIELVLLIGRHPKLSIYITMFTTVSWNLFKFLLSYALLIIAFALSFFILFRQGKKSDKHAPDQPEEAENFFSNVGGAMLKTVVMLTGEFDLPNIPLETFKIASLLVFLLFIFLIAVVLLNLLTGLAVSDTQDIMDKAELVVYKSRVSFLSYVESILNGKLLRQLSMPSGCIGNNDSCATNEGCCYQIFKFFCPRINIFPEIRKISVLVNQKRIIKPRSRSSIITSIFSWTMDASIIMAAHRRISKKTFKTSPQILLIKMDEIEQHFKAIESRLKDIQSIS